MTTLAPEPRLDPVVLEARGRQRRFLISGGVAVMLLTGSLGSVGGSTDGTSSWTATVHTAPSVQGAAIALVALTWLVCRWQQHDTAFVERLQRLVLRVVWWTFAIVAAITVVTLSTWAPGSAALAVPFPVELVVELG